MQSVPVFPPARRHPLQASRPPFSVVAIHDGFFASIRAMEALEWLKFILCPELQIHPASWSFEKLERQEVRATSVRAAAAADLLIVSAAGEMPLPDHVKLWLESIQRQQRDTRPILVALNEEDFELNGTPGPLCTHLRRVADTWQTEFMCNADFDHRLNRDFATQLVSSKSMLPATRAKPFGGEFPTPPRCWGING